MVRLGYRVPLSVVQWFQAKIVGKKQPVETFLFAQENEIEQTYFLSTVKLKISFQMFCTITR